MLKVVFSVEVNETLQKDDQKFLDRDEVCRELVVLCGGEGGNFVLIKGEWFKEFKREEKSVVMRGGVEARGIFDGDYGFVNSGCCGGADLLCVPVEAIESIFDTDTEEFIYPEKEGAPV